MAVQVKLTWVSTPSYTGYKKFIKGKVYYLGRDESEARKKVFAILSEQPSIQNLSNSPAQSIQLDRPKVKSLTLEQAVEQFKEHVKLKAIAPAWKITLNERIGKVLKLMGGKKQVNEIDYDWMFTFISKLTARPTGTTGKQVSAQTALNLMQISRQFFGWLDESGRWVPSHSCRRWERMFQQKSKLKRMTRSSKIKQMTLDEWAKLYVHASTPMRNHMIVSLNTGALQNDLATITRDMIDLEERRLNRNRNKTGIASSYSIWRRSPRITSWSKTPKPRDVGDPLNWCAESPMKVTLSMALIPAARK